MQEVSGGWMWSCLYKVQPAPLGIPIKNASIFACYSLVEPSVGFEPTTYGLQNRCSTN